MKPSLFPASVVLLLSFPVLLPAQPNAQDAYLRDSIQLRAFDQEVWESLSEGLTYEAGKKEKDKKKVKDVDGDALSKLGTLLKVLAVLGLLGLLVLVFFKMMDGRELLSPRNRKLQPAVGASSLDLIEENLESADLEDPIRQAVKSEAYALAIRLHYLAILKELSQKGHIRWKREKTNGEYLLELRGSHLLPSVRQATLVFERVWYGETAPGLEEYTPMAGMLLEVLAHVRQDGPVKGLSPAP